MKLVYVFLITSFMGYFAWSVTCTPGSSACTVTDDGNGCKVPPGGCSVDADGVCYQVLNSTGNTIFVPTKAGTNNWSTFYTNLGTNISRAACP